MICQTKLTLAQQMELVRAIENVDERVYVEGVKDGESAYQAYDFYGESTLGPRYAKELQMCFNTSRIRLAKGYQSLMIDELLDIAYASYRLGIEDGESACQDYDFYLDSDEKLADNIKTVLRKYEVIE